MDISIILLTLYEGAFVIAVFLLTLLLATIKGRQFMINTIFGLYFGLLFTLVSPFAPTGAETGVSSIWVSLAVFIVATAVGTLITAKLMPEPFREKKFESFGKKLYLTIAATILITLYSFHVVPVDELINFSRPVQYLFANEASFFWWLFTPFLLLYFHK